MWGVPPSRSLNPLQNALLPSIPLAPQRIKENHIQSEGVVEPHILITDGQIESEQKKIKLMVWDGPSQIARSSEKRTKKLKRTKKSLENITWPK